VKAVLGDVEVREQIVPVTSPSLIGVHEVIVELLLLYNILACNVIFRELGYTCGHKGVLRSLGACLEEPSVLNTDLWCGTVDGWRYGKKEGFIVHLYGH